MFHDCVVLLFIIIALKKTVVKSFNMFSYDLLISFDDLIDTFEKKYLMALTLGGFTILHYLKVIYFHYCLVLLI